MLPYAFKGLSYALSARAIRQYNLVSQARLNANLGRGIFKQFSIIHTNILQSMRDHDHQFLKQVMEPRLYSQTAKGLSQIKNNNQSLQFVKEIPKRQDTQNDIGLTLRKVREYGQHRNIHEFPFTYQEKDMQINIDCKGYFGVRILRHQNEGKRLIKIPSSLLATRKYYINLQNPMDIWRNQVIVLNMLFKTTRKLILVNGGQSEEGEWEYHKWRFESYIPELEWMLTDMDDSLKGNDYRIMNNIKND